MFEVQERPDVLTFLVIFVNLLITEFFFNRKYTYLKFAFSTIASILVGGAILYYSFEPTNTNKPFKVALVSQNLNPDIKWDPNNGNELAKNIIDQCKDAANENPDFMVWTEGFVPWTYAPNDDLLNEIFKMSKGKNITQVIGLNAEFANDDKKLYNSVFYFDENPLILKKVKFIEARLLNPKNRIQKELLKSKIQFLKFYTLFNSILFITCIFNR